MHGAYGKETINLSKKEAFMATITLSKFDRFVAEMAVREGKFHRVNEDKLPRQGVVCACPDCDQVKDYGDHLHSKGMERRQHVGVAGGPITLAYNSPAASLDKVFADFVAYLLTNAGYPLLAKLVKPFAIAVGKPIRADVFGFLQIYIGLAKKQINDIPLMPHIPCALAHRYDINLVQQLQFTITAKRQLKYLFKNVKVACLVHIDWGDGRKETWKFSTLDLLEWIEDNRAVFAEAKTRLAE